MANNINFNPNGCGDRISDNKGNPYWTDERLQSLANSTLECEEKYGESHPVSPKKMRNLANKEFAHRIYS